MCTMITRELHEHAGRDTHMLSASQGSDPTHTYTAHRNVPVHSLAQAHTQMCTHIFVHMHIYTPTHKCAHTHRGIVCTLTCTHRATHILCAHSPRHAHTCVPRHALTHFALTSDAVSCSKPLTSPEAVAPRSSSTTHTTNKACTTSSRCWTAGSACFPLNSIRRGPLHDRLPHILDVGAEGVVPPVLTTATLSTDCHPECGLHSIQLRSH